MCSSDLPIIGRIAPLDLHKLAFQFAQVLNFGWCHVVLRSLSTNNSLHAKPLRGPHELNSYTQSSHRTIYISYFSSSRVGGKIQCHTLACRQRGKHHCIFPGASNASHLHPSHCCMSTIIPFCHLSSEALCVNKVPGHLPAEPMVCMNDRLQATNILFHRPKQQSK